jgi:NAD(P)-dependent dehydrogenase (short-subunit alcohol dehydrogenase family)
MSTIVLTGAGRGIGYATALRLAGLPFTEAHHDEEERIPSRDL